VLLPIKLGRKNEHQIRKETEMKLNKKNSRSKELLQKMYDYYIAIDWSIETAWIARMKSNSSEPKAEEIKPDIKAIIEYLKCLKGTKILTIEETTGSHWLYVELREYLDKIIICDPYRNGLLSEGPKTDKIDAIKLCRLLRSGLLKEVYHSVEDDYKMRKLVSSYEDIVKAGVRVKNQRSAMYRAVGLKTKAGRLPNEPIYKLVESNQNKAIELYIEQKEEYEKVFRDIRKTNPVIRNLCSIHGIAEISAAKILARVIDARRFENKYKYWSYCGLIKHEKQSSTRSYGKKKPRYCRMLKGDYKIAALAAIGGKNDLREYYDYLIKEKYLSETQARNQIARYIAKVSYGILKNNQKYKPYLWRKKQEQFELSKI
jgi:transposase